MTYTDEEFDKMDRSFMLHDDELRARLAREAIAKKAKERDMKIEMGAWGLILATVVLILFAIGVA
jgi:hypothetical protein